MTRTGKMHLLSRQSLRILLNPVNATRVYSIRLVHSLRKQLAAHQEKGPGNSGWNVPEVRSKVFGLREGFPARFFRRIEKGTPQKPVWLEKRKRKQSMPNGSDFSHAVLQRKIPKRKTTIQEQRPGHSWIGSDDPDLFQGNAAQFVLIQPALFGMVCKNSDGSVLRIACMTSICDSP